MQNHAVFESGSKTAKKNLVVGVMLPRKPVNDGLSPQTVGTSLLLVPDMPTAISIEKRLYHLRQRIHRCHQQRASDKQVMRVYLEAASIMLDCHRYKEARDICYSLLQCLTSRYSSTHSETLLALQKVAWLQLVKIDRVEGNYLDAFQKIKIVKSTCDDNNLYDVFVESIKLRFSTSQFSAVSDEIECHSPHFIEAHQAVIAEALAISYIRQQASGQASHVLTLAESAATGIEKLILNWRLSEAIHQSRQAIRDPLMTMSTTMLVMLDSRNTPSQELNFALYLSQWLRLLGEDALACRLLYAVLKRADYTGDELLKAKSLARLYDIVNTAEAKRIIEDVMIHLYHHTHYLSARQIMLSVYEELKFVEVKNQPYYLDLLIDELVINVQLFS